jgi:hypothetical protein
MRKLILKIKSFLAASIALILAVVGVASSNLFFKDREAVGLLDY